jgi:hypothetical protein
MSFFEGYITQDNDSAEVFRGIDPFCQFFALKDFLSYRPLKIVWTDQPTAVRIRVKQTQRAEEFVHQWLLPNLPIYKTLFNFKLIRLFFVSAYILAYAKSKGSKFST